MLLMLLLLSEWQMMRYENPVLIVHGTDDELVDIDYKAAKNISKC